MRGRYFWNKRTGADLLKAVDNFKRVIENDSNYALAYSGLADCYILLPEYGVELPEIAIPKAKEAIRKALEIDGESAEIYVALGYTQAFYD
jgi:serine/threonine-protein kinase